MKENISKRKKDKLSDPTALGTQVNFENLGYDAQDEATLEMQKETQASAQPGALVAVRAVWASFADIGRGFAANLRGNTMHYGNSKEDFKRFLQDYKKSLLMIMTLVVFVLVVVLLAVWFVKNDNKYTLEQGAVQYYAGQSFTIEAGAVLERGLEEQTTITTSTGQTELTSLVIYQEEIDTVILPQNMIYYDPRSGYFATISALSQISCTSTGIYVTTGNETESINRGFLYDGSNYYLFLEAVIVNYNGYEIELPAMSYIEAIYESHVMIFNYETKETILQEVKTEIVVTTEVGEYTLSLINDLLEYESGDKMLLFSRPDLLDNLFA